MKRYVYGALLFVGYALLGPAIASYSHFTGLYMNAFFYNFVAQTWPFWMLAQYEPTMGLFVATALGAACNVVVFAILGVLGAAVSRSGVALALLFAGACVAQLMWFRFGIGSFPSDLSDYLVLTAACCLMAVPFLVLARLRE